MTIKLQVQQSSGHWVDVEDEDRINMFLDAVLGREAWYAQRVGREPMTSREQVLEHLATGQRLNWDSDWYNQIRIKPQPKPAPAAARVDYSHARRLACGHYVYAAEDVMTTSGGTSCPRCYDRMSNE